MPKPKKLITELSSMVFAPTFKKSTKMQKVKKSFVLLLDWKLVKDFLQSLFCATVFLKFSKGILHSCPYETVFSNVSMEIWAEQGNGFKLVRAIAKFLNPCCMNSSSMKHPMFSSVLCWYHCIQCNIVSAYIFA